MFNDFRGLFKHVIKDQEDSAQTPLPDGVLLGRGHQHHSTQIISIEEKIDLADNA